MTRRALALAAVLAAGACQRERRALRPPSGEVPPAALAPLTAQRPGPAGAPVPNARPVSTRDDAAGSAWATAEGQRLFTWYNCSGCHANGGGGMGPPLMDAAWLYGSQPLDVYRTIVQGRPGGMPSFAGRIPEFQVWQLVAYVRSLAGLLRRDVEPSRSDNMAVKEPESMRPRQPPRRAGRAP